MIQLTDNDKEILLSIARKTLKNALRLDQFNLSETAVPEKLMENGASFVTLTIDGRLRGCIGALSAYQPLVQDVCEHVLAAAFEDPRFPPLTVGEESLVRIEISYLTPPVRLDYDSHQDLLKALVPGRDGLILSDGYRRATYLPQVWEQIPVKEDFLGSLCQKMGARRNLWKEKKLQVETYQAIHFSEGEFSKTP